ncbi:metallophosphoesterase [Rhizobium sp. BE258]|uniref:metallophosphoesterase n=1 Tax=Rhizobium sp. BE258 TaxID=2817722 RepID=UPI00286C4AD8|nr:metallophosphoesterase [Rhizobium sp. BE258]
MKNSCPSQSSATYRQKIAIRSQSSLSDIYAIGDIHGRADLLEALLGHIAAIQRAGSSQPVIMFLGDLIDRGPRSPEVLDLVSSALDRYPGSRLVLGNHDHYLRSLLRDELAEDDATNWMDWGGVATVSAYSRQPVPNRDTRAFSTSYRPPERRGDP